MTTSRNNTMAGARFSASVRTSGAELPECFAEATVASAAKASYLKRPADARDLRRLSTKVSKLERQAR